MKQQFTQICNPQLKESKEGAEATKKDIQTYKVIEHTQDREDSS